MAQTQQTGGKGDDRARLPKSEDDDERVLADSKLGAAQEEDVTGESEEDALARSKLGAADDGGLNGQGGMRDPSKTSDPKRMKPS
jgi:hypothetical protein